MTATPQGIGAAPVIGSGPYAYYAIQNWAKLPAGWSFNDVADVEVDSQDRVYVFCRGDHPLIVFDRDGNFLTSWGKDIFTRPHALHMAPDDTLYCTDDGDHSVRKCTVDGKVLLTLGVPGRPSEPFSGKPFSRCTHSALSPSGEIYVSDGYQNACVHKYTPEGKYMFTWGRSGVLPGEFNTPHNIVCDDDGWVYVSDRESHRIQVFDANGKYETQWNNFHRPLALYLTRERSPRMYIGEAACHHGVNKAHPNLGCKIKVYAGDKEGRMIAQIGDGTLSYEAGKFFAMHGLAVDSRGDIYVAEVSYSAWPQLYPDQPVPPDLRSLHKLVRIAEG